MCRFSRKGLLGLKLLMRISVGNFMNAAADAQLENNMKQMFKYVLDPPINFFLVTSSLSLLSFMNNYYYKTGLYIASGYIREPKTSSSRMVILAL